MGTQQQVQRQCVKCGAVLWNLQVCNQCGASQPRFEDSVTPGPWPAIRIGLGILAALLLARLAYGRISGEMIGHWFVSLLLPAIIGSIALIMKGERLRRFSYWFMWAAIAVAVFSAMAHVVNVREKARVAVEAQIREIAQEAAGKKPVQESGTPEERVASDLLRDFMRGILADRKQHDMDAEVYAPLLSVAYSVHSFSSKTAMNKTMVAVDSTAKLDKDTYQLLQTRITEFRRRLDSSNISSDFKQTFLEEFNGALANSEILKQQEEVLNTENEWARATDALYTYASQYSSQLNTAGNQVIVKNAQVRQEFHTRLSKCLDLNNKVNAGKAELKNLQVKKMQQYGLTASDLGQ